MRNHNLSQEGQWALRQRARCAAPRKGHDWEGWLDVGLYSLAVVIIILAFLPSCGKVLEPQTSAPVWKCLKAPHISIAFDGYDSQGYGYFRLVSRNESTECQALAIDLITMLKDGHWEQIQTGNPLFIPPPPQWHTGVSDKLDIGGTIRINGSDAIRMRTQTPLPTDNQITVEKGQTK